MEQHHGPHAVSAPMVLKAVMTVKRKGNVRMMKQLERREPDLAEFAMEELSRLYRQLLDLGGEPRPTARLQREIETMALVLVEACQRQKEQRQRP